MSESVKKSIAVQGSILAIAGIITKIIGFLYRIPMANVMGNTGNGLYSVSFGIYNIALTLSSYSMPLAVSKLLSARLAKGQYKDAHKLFSRALIFAFITGSIACLALYFGADFFAEIYKKEGLERPLQILAPTTFVVALLGTLRGYYQGHKNMVPTAISQVIEQIVNAIVSVVASAGFVAACAVETEKASFGAMGGTLGTLAGAFSALLVFIVLFIFSAKQRKLEKAGEDEITEGDGLIYKSIVFTMIPVIISQSIYTFGYTVDDFLFGNIQALKGMEETVATELQGVFNTQYNQMINLPTAVATAMASATLPSVVASFTVGDHNRVKEKIDSVLKINMLIAIPSFIGLAVLADPIMSVLFPGLKEYHDTAMLLLMSGSSAVVFYTLSTISTSVLQGCDKMRIPVYHAGISLVVHILLVGGLLYFTNLNVYALVIGNVTFPMLVCILNIRSVKKLLSYNFDIKSILLKPFGAAALMGIMAGLVYYGGSFLFGVEEKLIQIILLATSMLVAISVYGVGLMLTGALTKTELKGLPVIKKFIK